MDNRNFTGQMTPRTVS